jgi:hypothetical protein
MPYNQRIIKRFWRYVDKRSDNECWNWLASKRPDGYAQIRDAQLKKNFYVHRVSYELNVS